VSKDAVVAFRLAAHHLSGRLGEDALLDAAGRCGIQNSPPGSALLALHARVRGVTQERVDDAVVNQKTLLQTWSLRGAPFYFPTADAPVFTAGVLPPSEEVMRHFLSGVVPALDTLGLTATEVTELIRAEIRDVLAGRRFAIKELGAELAERVAAKLPERQRRPWEAEGPYAPGQPLGEGVVHFCLRILTLQGVLCFAPRAGNKAPFVLVDEWLGGPIPDTDPESARAELVRRYLRAYGPSTRADFSAWAGIQAGDAGPWWSRVEDELTPVEHPAEQGGPSWILTEDLDALRSPPSPRGVRLLPPRDPYTQQRDRDTIVDKKYHRDVWKTIGEPGTVLADGKIVGIWRPRKSGRKLTISVTAFGSLSGRHRTLLHEEAEQVAPLRGASSVTVEYGPT
jgi:hypothetical protein